MNVDTTRKKVKVNEFRFCKKWEHSSAHAHYCVSDPKSTQIISRHDQVTSVSAMKSRSRNLLDHKERDVVNSVGHDVSEKIFRHNLFRGVGS